MSKASPPPRGGLRKKQRQGARHAFVLRAERRESHCGVISQTASKPL